ncbi:MAG: vitamin B12-dependent ribonucleotide reductase [Deltaproteobacteria bacterium]|nr:vitamin B12-dependent ribonucleotide reductase [Deltaproteobacteria bacterium]
MKLTDNARKVLERRYLKRNEAGVPVETSEQMFMRVAYTIAKMDAVYDAAADIEQLAQRFYGMMANLEFLPNSPTLMNAGRELGQLSACFVLPVEDSMESIFETIKNTALIHKSGGGTGFSFSRVRPKNDVVLSTKGISSGPISFMTVFDAATETIKQGGTRRGANMGILRVDHPDILEFIQSKEKTDKLNNFNISVALTDTFMKAVEGNGEYDLLNPRTRQPAGTLSAREVFDSIVHHAWLTGEPGIIFLDRINKANPTPHIGEIESTNPCGEQPLLPYESCNLGSINLARMVKGAQGAKEAAARAYEIDWHRLEGTARDAVHFLDNVIDANRFPLSKIEQITKENRKVGLGVMGFADMLIMLGIPYDSDEAIETAGRVMKTILDAGREMSYELAEKRGAFPNFRGSIYDTPGARPLRNSTITTIAPTGTLSIIAGVSSGIEPIFALAYTRNVLDNTELPEMHPLFFDRAKGEHFYSDELVKKVLEKGSVRGVAEVPANWQQVFGVAHDITPVWHIKMQAAFQRYVDNAVSKTVNFHRDATEHDVEDVYWLAYKLGCKGVTVYRDGSRESQVLTIMGDSRRQKGSTELQKQFPGPKPRPEVISGTTRRMTTGCGNLYVTINEDKDGPFEVFAAMGKAGGCSSSQTEAISRLISLSLRSGVDRETIVKQLKGVRCPAPARERGGGVILSCADAIAKAIERHLEEKQGGPPGDRLTFSIDETGISGVSPKHNIKETPYVLEGDTLYPSCPECGSVMMPTEGCYTCPSCGYSKCL